MYLTKKWHAKKTTLSLNVKRNLDQNMMCVQSLTHEIFQIEKKKKHQGYRIPKSKRLSTICLSTICIAL